MVSGNSRAAVPAHLVSVLLASLVVALVALVAAPVAAHADEVASESDSVPCAQIRDDGDDTLSVIGRVCDRRETPPRAVPDVTITVTEFEDDEKGEVVAEATTGEDGTFKADLPGEPIDLLGTSFLVTIDEDSLPEDTAPEVLEREVAFNLEADQSVTFPIGAAGPEATGKATQALQLAIGGLVFAIVLAMAALGLSMVFGTTGLTNFSHGELVTFGALVAFAFDRLPGAIEIFGLNVTVIVGVVAAFVLGGLFGWLNDAGLWRPLRSRGTGLVAMMIISIGLSIFLRNLYQYLVGAAAHNYSQYSAVTPWELGPINFTPKQLIVILLGATILIITTSLLQFTRTGKAMRAVADNPALASATGINVERVTSIVWIGGAALAGLSGALLGLTQGFDYQTGFKILLLIFAAVILGGLGTIWGAIIGAFIIAMMTELSTLFVPSEFKFVGALLVLIIVLLFRPQGLLGRVQRIG